MTGTEQVLTRLIDVEEKYRDNLLKKQHVVCVSVGPVREKGRITGDYALFVMVDEMVSPESLSQEDQIPSTLDGMPVKVYETGIA